MARVIISAGHTKKEPGALIDDLQEVDLARTIANKVTSKLRQTGIVTLSVPPELDLSKRIEWINNTGYGEETEDICLEFHINDGGKSGLEGWFQERGENKSQELTELILEESCKSTGLTNQGAKSELDHPLNTLAFVHKTNPTSSLIECLYIDNPDDQNFLRDDSKLVLLAEGIVNGIFRFFKVDTQQDISTQQVSQGVQQTYKPQQTSPAPSLGSTYMPPPPIQTQTQPQAYTTPPSTPFPSPYGGMGTYGQPTQQQAQSVEEKKKMIADLYQKILGRKVNDQDMNYFLNLGLNEDQMIKRLVESQEHVDIVKESQEYKEIKPTFDKLKIEKQELQSKVADQEKIVEQQNELIAQKNKSIQEMHQKEIPSEPQTLETEPTYPSVSPGESISPDKPTPSKESLVDKMLRKLNDIFD